MKDINDYVVTCDDSGTDDCNQKSFPYKYEEDWYLDELKEYIQKTYQQHYSKNKYQATEFIIDSGHGEGFLIGNIMKYAQRYGKKGTWVDSRKDLLKVLHYALIMLYVHDQTDNKQMTDDLINEIQEQYEAVLHGTKD